jgi:glycosyltransferase involved in cell wall biosynthesis
MEGGRGAFHRERGGGFVRRAENAESGPGIAMAKENVPGDTAQPLVSIITACYNAAGSIEASIRSVRSQTYPNIEHIVIDGGSKDGTADIIRKHADGLAYWISERDKGIADAWNKGLARAKGRIIGTLNADDIYDERAVEAAVAAFAGQDDCIVYGTTRFFRDDPAKTIAEIGLAFDPQVLEYGFGFVHTTCFVPRRIYGQVGEFDTRYRIAIDTDFLLRCHFRGIPFRQAGNVTYMRAGGLSQKRRTEAYLEFLQQLYRQGHPRLRLLKALLIHYRQRILGRAPIPGIE